MRAAHNEFRATTKLAWNRERTDVQELLLNIQTKLKTYGLRDYVPEDDLSVEVRALLEGQAHFASMAESDVTGHRAGMGTLSSERGTTFASDCKRN